MADTAALGYTAEHEWVAVDGDIATIGITDHAADQLGDIVYVDLPKVGSSIAAGKVVGEIESTKSVGELFAPVEGTVVEVDVEVRNEGAPLDDTPYRGPSHPACRPTRTEFSTGTGRGGAA